ncbi:MAG: sensor histidine kinase, partial [Lentimicrobium sp.]|uniref:tetratricopeptide repeat-containing sensor histidine kinase n=1 Tax=Lentimicrobium sp. TaxID=2034841 RepID=UPI0025D49EC6
LAFSFQGYAASYTDSLLNVISRAKGVEKFNAYNQLFDYYEANDHQSALQTVWQQMDFSRQSNNREWVGGAFANLGSLYLARGMADSAGYFFARAYKQYKEAGNDDATMNQLCNISNACRLTFKFEEALAKLQKVLDYYTEQKDDFRIAQALANMGTIYNEMGNNGKHDEYMRKALEIQYRLPVDRSRGISLINLCLSLSSQRKFEEAFGYGREAVEVFRQLNDPFFTGACLVRAGSAAIGLNNDGEALKYAREAYSISEQTGNDHLRAEALRLLADYYMKHSDFEEAREVAYEAFSLADTSNKSDMIYHYDLLTTLSIQTGDKQNALKFYTAYVKLKNEAQEDEFRDKISEMEVRYESEKKELIISNLKGRQKLQWIGILTGTLIFLIVVLLLMLRQKNLKQRRLLAEQKVKQLEQEKLTIATQSVLDGETAERSRLARDLHDGLGGMLSAVKLNLFDVKSGVILETEDVQKFNRVVNLLDESMQELRRVAHNMMPESLSRYGLKVALNDFCRSIPNLKFHFFGNEDRLEPRLEVMIYRTIHELVNNALKHASADAINVQLIQQMDSVTLTVHDDGRGFDPAAAVTGTGLNNIRSRAEMFRGTVDIGSAPGKGTEVSVSFMI